MSLRVYNAPDVERLQTADVFRVSEANRDRNFGSGYQQSFLGTDALQLSGDYEGQPRSNGRNSLRTLYSYSNLIKLLLIMVVIVSVIIGALAALVAVGGIIALVVTALALFLSVFLYSINLNPFKKSTYKKLLGYLG
jgi:hypothetical protein